MDYYRSNRAYCRERSQAQCPAMREMPNNREMPRSREMSRNCDMPGNCNMSKNHEMPKNRETQDYCNKLECPSLAMAYVPYQKFNKMFDLSKGLQMGTIFPELCLPFCGKRGVRR